MADVMITLTLDLEQLKQGLDKVKVDLKDVEKVRKIDIDTRETESKIKRIRDSFAMWGLAIQGAISSAKLVGSAISGMIQPALDAERAITRVETAVKSTGGAAGYTADELKRLAEGYQEAFAFDADDIMNQVTTPLLTFTNITGEAFRGAQEAVMNMTRALGDDGGGLQGVAMQVGKALQDPITGITALRRAGVSFSEDQQAVIKSLVETGDLASAQKMILEELGKEFGGQAASYANSYAGSLEAMKIQFEDMMESIGQDLLPILVKFADAIKTIVGWFGNLGGVTRALVVALPLLTAAWYRLMTTQAAAAVATGTLTTSLAAAKAAVTGFLTSMGPVGWVLMAATAAVAGYAIATGGAADESKKLNEAQTELTDETRTLHNEHSAAISKYDTLVNRLISLKKQTNLAANEQNQMKGIVNELQQNYGSYIKNINLEGASWTQVANALSLARANLVNYYVAEETKGAFEGKMARLAELKVQVQDLLQANAPVELDIYSAGFGKQVYDLLSYYGSSGGVDERKKWVNEAIRAWNEWQGLQTEINTKMPGYQKALEQSFQLSAPTANPNTYTYTAPSGGAAAAAVGDVSTALTDFARMKEELAKYFRDEGTALFMEYSEKIALIEANTAKGSVERMELLNQAKHWYDEESIKLEERKQSAYLVDTAAYFEEVKFLDAGYYKWKKLQIEDDIRKMDLSTDQAKLLADERIAKLDEEKAAWEAMPLDEVLAKYAAWKAQMADTKAIGVAGWETIRDGLIAIRDELQKFADMPGVAGILAGIESEIDVATLNAGKKKGNWFFHGLLGFDPDNEDDQAKVSAVKNTYSYLSSQIQDITNGLLQMNESRRKKELDRIQEVAEREKWSKERLLAAQAETNARYDKEERKLKNVQKNLSYVQAVINIAEGVTKALALGPILGPIMAGVISAMGIVQLGIIKAQKFASGGLFRGKGGPRDDANIVAISDGEYIVNAAATRRYKPVLDLLNSGSSAALDSDGGASYSFVAGGMVRGGGVSGLLERLIEKIEILNLNLVKKDMSVTVENRSEIESIVKHSDRARVRLERRGYVPSLS